RNIARCDPASHVGGFELLADFVCDSLILVGVTNENFVGHTREPDPRDPTCNEVSFPLPHTFDVSASNFIQKNSWRDLIGVLETLDCALSDVDTTLTSMEN